MLTRKEFETGVLKSYQLLYLKYGENQRYTPKLAAAVIELLLMEYPKIFQIKPENYAAALPGIFDFVPYLLEKERPTIYALALELTVAVLKNTQARSRFFYPKVIYWLLINPRIRTCDTQYLQI